MVQKFSVLILIVLLTLAACNTAPAPTPSDDVGAGVPGAGVVAATPTTNAAFAPPVPTAIPPTLTPTPTLAPTLAPTPTPDPIGETTVYQDPILGITFNHPVSWSVDNVSQTRLAVGGFAAVQAAVTNPDGVPSDFLMSISAEQSSNRKPLSLLSDKAPTSNPNFTVFPEPIVINDYEGAHSVREVTNTETGVTRVIESYVLINEEDAYYFEIQMSLLALAENQLFIDAVMDSMQFTGVDRQAIAGSLAQEREDVDGGELFIDSVVTGTIETGINYVVGLGRGGKYLFSTVADKADIVMTISSVNDPETPLLTVDNSFSAEPEAVIWSPPFDGGYIINLRDFSFTGGAYAFAIYRVWPEVNHNPTIEFRRNTRPLIFLQPEPGFDLAYKVISPNGIPILFVDNKAVGEAEPAIPIGLENTSYTLEIGSPNGIAGTFTTTVAYVRDYFNVPSLRRDFGVATPLATNSITTGITGSNVHYITVESNRPHVLLANGNRDSDLVIRISDLDGVEQLVVDDYATGEIESRVVALPVGNYILEVEDWRGNSYEYAAGFYEFFPSATGSAEFELGPEQDAVVIIQPDDNFDVVLTAEDLNYNQVANRDGGFNGAPEVVVFQAGRSVPKGTYTAVGTGFDDTRGDYQIGVIYVDRDFVDTGNR